MKKIVLGIDLGGCMSGNTAYILVQYENDRAIILQSFKEPKHKEPAACFEFLKETLCKFSVDAIAIDAPFSLPKALIDPHFIPLPRDAGGEIDNPFLYRYCDYWLYKHYALRPMPPAGDRIGRLTARMIQLLNSYDYRPPYISLPQGKTPIYEVYPKQIAQALGFTGYKNQTKELLEYFKIDDIKDEHMIDALLCSFCASRILQGRSLLPPPEAEDEGWCYPLL